MKPSKWGGWYCPRKLGNGSDEYCKERVKERKPTPPVQEDWLPGQENPPYQGGER